MTKMQRTFVFVVYNLGALFIAGGAEVQEAAAGIAAWTLFMAANLGFLVWGRSKKEPGLAAETVALEEPEELIVTNHGHPY